MGEVRVEWRPVGRPLLDALTHHVAATQTSDPLTPVTVIAPSRTSALALRRRAASALGGLFGVRFETLPRVAELLAAPGLASQGRLPAGAAARAEAVRMVLRREPGALAEVADHPATAQALERTLADLSEVPPSAVRALPGRRGRELAQLHTRVRALLRDHYDAGELLWAAAEAVASGAVDAREFGAFVALVTEPPSPAEAALLAALSQRQGLTCLAGITGEEPLDHPLRAALDPLGAEVAAAPAGGSPPEGRADTAPTTTAAADTSARQPVDRIVSAVDPDSEVRAAVRLLAQRFHQGTPPHQMALLWTARRPYALLVRDALAAAGLRASGLPRPRLTQSPAGRAVLGALALAGGDLPRDEVMHWLAAAPIRASQDGPEADGARWDALSRRAGVVRGRAQWLDRLDRYAFEQRARAERDRHEGDADGRHWETEAAQAEALRRFVDELGARLRPPRGSWAAWSGWASALLDRYSGAARADWTDHEAEAERAVRQSLRRLAELDRLGGAPDLAAFRQAVQAELDAPYGAQPKLAEGVFTGDLRAAAGMEFRVVVVVGMAEGLAPARVREDPLLPDRDRHAIPGMRVAAEQARASRRGLHWVLAGDGERVLCTPRSDPRGGRARMPSRWLLHEAGRLHGAPLRADDLAVRKGAPWLQWIASFPQSLREYPAGESDLRLGVLTAAHAAGALALDHALDGEARLARGFAALRDRRSGVFGRWTGLVGPVPAVGLGPAALSPTRLESWAACPFRYFLTRVLDVEAVARPEEAVRIDPRERGGLIHRVLERFLSEAVVPAPGAPWPGEERARLHAIADAECARWERQGVTGKALLWRLDRERLHRELDAFLDAEPALRGRHQTASVLVEHAFGFDGTGPELAVADGPAVRFHGYIDRIDRSGDGAAMVVVDYKTGRPAPYRKALDADPIALGQLLQLPVYALAARQAADDGFDGAQDSDGRQPVTVHAAYWFLDESGIEEVAWDPAGAARFTEAVGTIARGIAQGYFPQRTGVGALSSESVCARCDVELVCDLDRERRWGRVRELPQFAGLRRLECGPTQAEVDDA